MGRMNGREMSEYGNRGYRNSAQTGHESGGYSRRGGDHLDGGNIEQYPVLDEGLKVSPDLRQYFQEIAPLVGPNGTVKDPEELAILCSNGLQEAEGNEAALACDAPSGRTLEALLKSADLPQVLAFLRGLSREHFDDVAKHYSGSHIIETALQALERHGDVAASKQALSEVCKAASASAVDLLCDRYGSHVLRRILSILSGRDVQPAQSKHLGQGQRATGANSPRGGPFTPPFPALLEQFAEGVASAAGPHVKQLRADSSAGPGLQAILLALEGQTAPLQRLVRTFLGCPESAGAARPVDVLADADPEEVAELMRERSGSHLVEVILKVSPPALQGEMFDRFFRTNLKDLALHPSANFVLQAMLAAAHSAQQVTLACEELEEHFPRLLRDNRGGVIAALVASCGRLGTHQKEVCRSLARAVTGQSSSPSRVVPDLLALEQHISSGNRWSKLPSLSCAILVTMFGFPKGSSQSFVDSMGSLTETECAALAADPGGARVVEAFLTGPALDKQKRLFVSRLRGQFGELAKTASSSHCVEKCFTASDIKLKEVIVDELAAAEAALLRTSHGPHILRKTSVSLYKSSPVSWRAHVSASEGARQMFADLLSERPSKRARKGGALTAAQEPPGREEVERADEPGGLGAGVNAFDEDASGSKSKKKRKGRRQEDSQEDGNGENALANEAVTQGDAAVNDYESEPKKGRGSKGKQRVESGEDLEQLQEGSTRRGKKAGKVEVNGTEDGLEGQREGKKSKRKEAGTGRTTEAEIAARPETEPEAANGKAGKKRKKVANLGAETEAETKAGAEPEPETEAGAKKLGKKRKKLVGCETEPEPEAAVEKLSKKKKNGKKAEELQAGTGAKKSEKEGANGGTSLDAIMGSLGFPDVEAGGLTKKKRKQKS